jgi:hypothetical protein
VSRPVGLDQEKPAWPQHSVFPKTLSGREKEAEFDEAKERFLMDEGT